MLLSVEGCVGVLPRYGVVMRITSVASNRYNMHFEYPEFNYAAESIILNENYSWLCAILEDFLWTELAGGF